MTRFETVAFYGGLIWYAAGTVSAFLAVRTGDRRRLALARWEALFGALMHAAFLAALGARTGHFPVTNAFEAFVFLSAAVVVLALALDWLRRLSILVVASLPLALVTVLLALMLKLVEPNQTTASQSAPGVWTSLHIFVALASYGAFALAFVTGILYLVEQRHLKQHATPSILGLMPSLETVSRVNVRSIAAGVVLLAGGIVVGYLNARQVYGIARWWRDDPKIILSTITFGVYLAVLALSGRPLFKGRRTAIASVFSFSLVLVTFWASIFWSGFHNFR